MLDQLQKNNRWLFFFPSGRSEERDASATRLSFFVVVFLCFWGFVLFLCLVGVFLGGFCFGWFCWLFFFKSNDSCKEHAVTEGPGK